jgi:hypothetical protein
MRNALSTAVLALGLSAAAGAFAQSTTVRPVPDTSGRIVVVEGTPSAAMRRLMDTTDNLRTAIQQLASRPPGPERDRALHEAQKALQVTQQAMLDLPPEYRPVAPTGGTAGYAGSVRNLMTAADTLRDSIHAMARQPAGSERNQAIRDANRALLETQAAMASAYDATAFPTHSVSLGAGPAKCVQLGSMTGCPLH